MSNTNQVLAALALSAATGAAQAGVVNVSQSVSLSTLLDGSSTSIAFDLNGALAQQGSRAGLVQSGELVVYGYSEPEYTQSDAYSGYQHVGTSSRSAQYSYTYYVSCGTWGWSDCARTGYSYRTVYDQTYERDHTVERTDAVKDEMQVTAGASTASDYADTFASSSSTSPYLTSVATNGSYSNGYTFLRQRERTSTSSFGGELAVGMALDTAALFDINNDGQFSFIVNAPGLSQFRVQGATINLLALLPVALPDGAVPEPATFGLFGGALGLLALLRRRRRTE